MTFDIRKLGMWLERAARETVAIENKVLEWKLAAETQVKAEPHPKAK
jgi:hypothetical protein